MSDERGCGRVKSMGVVLSRKITLKRMVAFEVGIVRLRTLRFLDPALVKSEIIHCF